MKMIRIMAALALLAGTLAITRADENQVWTGSLVDASCYLTDSSQSGNEHMGMKECGVACLKMGRPAGIVTPDKKFFVLVTPSPDIAEYVGQPIRVSSFCWTKRRTTSCRNLESSVSTGASQSSK